MAKEMIDILSQIYLTEHTKIKYVWVAYELTGLFHTINRHFSILSTVVRLLIVFLD